ncbi:MAG TPA: LysR substrate-binding domain-containing protein [Novosphingobium sp.]
MDIAQLRTLIHVAELGSVTAAADRLGIAQPALSRQIRLLENELGGALFSRHGRGMTLTELGHQVIGPASDILMRLDDIRRCARDRGTLLVGKVRVGVTPTVAEVATLPLVRAIRTAHPRLSLCFTTGFSGHLVEWLKRGELDCCVSYAVSGGGLVHTVPILDETLLLVAAPGGRLVADTPVSFASLANEPMVLPSPAHGLRAILDAAATQAGITLSASLEADSLAAMIDLVRAGYGATILPYAPIHARVKAGELIAVPLINPVPGRRIVMTYPADREISPAARFVGDSFAAVAGELVASGNWTGSVIGT